MVKIVAALSEDLGVMPPCGGSHLSVTRFQGLSPLLLVSKVQMLVVQRHTQHKNQKEEVETNSLLF